jgi:hypothetical protein
MTTSSRATAIKHKRERRARRQFRFQIQAHNFSESLVSLRVNNVN